MYPFMKTVLTSLACAGIFFLSVNGQATKDLPRPVANLMNLPANSYVIPMDNNLQQNSSGVFNLKAYGLIVHLLNNKIKLKWVIRSGKLKDAADFSVAASRIYPVTDAITTRIFLSGPFVINAADTTGVSALINSFVAANGLTGNNRPAVFRTTQAVMVDVRYDMAGYVPKAGVIKDGNNTAIHLSYFEFASVPKVNYDTIRATELLTRCFNFASEPHDDVVAETEMRAVRSFITNGGNFLAQCEAVLAYENNNLGRFQTTNGITKVNANISATSVAYPNADLSFSQFQGEFSISQGGSVRNWQLATLSFNANNTHAHATNNNLSRTPIGASVSKLTGADKGGGLVFYLGGHEFNSLTGMSSINGIRMYLNAFLTPASLNNNCAPGAILLSVLSFRPAFFDVAERNGKAHLNWGVSNEINLSAVIVEKSMNSVNFESVKQINANDFTDQNGIRRYTFEETLTEHQSIVYYRIKFVDFTGAHYYSEVKNLRYGQFRSGAKLKLYPNPFVKHVTIQLPSARSYDETVLQVADLLGKVILQSKVAAGQTLLSLDLSQITAGTYFLKVINKEIVYSQQIIKN